MGWRRESAGWVEYTGVAVPNVDVLLRGEAEGEVQAEVLNEGEGWVLLVDLFSVVCFFLRNLDSEGSVVFQLFLSL